MNATGSCEYHPCTNRYAVRTFSSDDMAITGITMAMMRTAIILPSRKAHSRISRDARNARTTHHFPENRFL